MIDQSLYESILVNLHSIPEAKMFRNAKGSSERIPIDIKLQTTVMRLLFFQMTDNGRYLPDLFPHKDIDGFPTTIDEALDLQKNMADQRFYGGLETKNIVHYHAGRNCGRNFQIGEPIYRCQECGSDDTCVLCIHCFNPADHQGHHVYTNICGDMTSGICDCGDGEAWKTELNCKAQEEFENNEKSNDNKFQNMNVFTGDCSDYIETTLASVFDFFIDLFDQNVEPLTSIQSNITRLFKRWRAEKSNDKIIDFLKEFEYSSTLIPEESYKSEDGIDSDIEMTPFEPYSNEDQDLSEIDSNIDINSNSPPPQSKLKDYTVMIYNDEFHNYSQATTALRQGVPDTFHVDILTSEIDREGRAMLKATKQLDTLLSGFTNVQINGLSATLTSWKEYLIQQIAEHIILWIKFCLNIDNPNFQQVFREHLGKVLCAPPSERFYQTSNSYNVRAKCGYHKKQHFYDISLLNTKRKIPFGIHPILKSEESISTTFQETTVLTPESELAERYKYTNSRLQYILYFDNRFWKRLRKDIQNVIIPTLSSSNTYKAIFSHQVCQIFFHILNSITFLDREPQLTVLRECIVQLFTCPTNVNQMFESVAFEDILWSANRIFLNCSKVENGLLIWQRVQITNPSKSYTIAFKQALYSIETILGKVTDPNFILKPSVFIPLVSLCKLFNGAWKIKRKEGEHVLHEDQHFITYLEYTTSIYGIIKTIDKVIKNESQLADKQLLSNAIRLLNTYLSHRILSYKIVDSSQEVIKFQVSNERVAYMNPIHTLFSLFIERVPLEEALKVVDNNSDFLVISDYPLRSIVLCAQIETGFWVRNGMSVLNQITYYKNNPELNSYARDLHINQLSFLFESDDLPRIVLNILDRWELLMWFNNTHKFTETVYEDKVSLVVQQFISFIYQMFTEKDFFIKDISSEGKRQKQIRSAIIYGLYIEPLSYSKLLKTIPDYLREETTEFDNILKEVSDFIEPKGLADSGVFQLKETIYSEIDPLKTYNTDNDFESSSNIIKTHLTKKKKDVNGIVLQPQITHPDLLEERVKNLGDFTRITIFAKLIYKLLQVSIDTEDGTFLYPLLHLIHAIFVDYSLINGKDALPEAYMRMPVCNLLLQITNLKSDTFSESILTKADYLLQYMIRRDKDGVFEILTSSFGESQVNSYKKKKLNQGVNLEETEKERKKRLAKKRQKKMLARFSNQQSKFMKEHEAEFSKEKLGSNDSDMDIDSESSTHTSDDFTCALCQDDKSSEGMIIPVYLENSSIFRSGDITNGNEFAAPWTGFFNDADKLAYTDDLTLNTLRKDGTLGSRKVFVSCNHHIHYSCFKKYIQKKRFTANSFLCPICQTYSNVIIPVYDMNKEKHGLSMNSLLKENCSATFLSKALKTFSAQDYKSMYSLITNVVSRSRGFDKKVSAHEGYQNHDSGRVLATYWANTISMLEISSRLANDPATDLLNGKEQKFKTLKCTLITIILICYSMGPPQNDFDFYMSDKNKKWNLNQLFQYIVKSTMFEEKPLADSIKCAISAFTGQFITDFIKRIREGNLEKLYNNVVGFDSLIVPSEEHSQDISNLLGEELNGSEQQHKEYSLAYSSLMKYLLPTLRRCFVYLKVLNNLIGNPVSDPLILNGIDIDNELTGLSTVDYVTRSIKILTGLSVGEIFYGASLYKKEIEEAPERIDRYLRDIPYEKCNVIKMINLSKHLNTYITNSKQIKLREEHSFNLKNVHNRLDFKICLMCGVKIHQRADHHEMFKHLEKYCFKPYGAFLIPNTGEVCLYLNSPASTVLIPAPYLNSHGETGKNAMSQGDLTTLNINRYKHLNKLWIENEIPGYVSRLMGDQFRVNILSNGFAFPFNGRFRPRRTPVEENSDEEETIVNEFGGDRGLRFFINRDDADQTIETADTDTEIRFHDARENLEGNPEDIEDDDLFRAVDEDDQDDEDADENQRFFRMFEDFRSIFDQAITEQDGTPAVNAAPLIEILGPRLRNVVANRHMNDDDEEVIDSENLDSTNSATSDDDEQFEEAIDYNA